MRGGGEDRGSGDLRPRTRSTLALGPFCPAGSDVVGLHLVRAEGCVREAPEICYLADRKVCWALGWSPEGPRHKGLTLPFQQAEVRESKRGTEAKFTAR